MERMRKDLDEREANEQVRVYKFRATLQKPENSTKPKTDSHRANGHRASVRRGSGDSDARVTLNLLSTNKTSLKNDVGNEHITTLNLRLCHK